MCVCGELEGGELLYVPTFLSSGLLGTLRYLTFGPNFRVAPPQKAEDNVVGTWDGGTNEQIDLGTFPQTWQAQV